jgi:multidrug efflux pump subunit AcrA (membrane-fusion protein)
VHDPAGLEDQSIDESEVEHAAVLDVVADGNEHQDRDEGNRRDRSAPAWFSPLGAIVLVVVVVAGLIAWEMTRGSSTTYRTGVVGTGTVEATLDSVGTIMPVNQAELNFNVSGTVSDVAVSVGQAVVQGQTLASLDVAALNATVDTAQASVATAKATLSSAEASETASTTSTTSSHLTTSTTPTLSPSGSGSGSVDSQSSGATVAPLQATLVSDQSQLDTDSALAGTSLQQATTVCATGSTSTTSTTSTTAPASGCSAALAQASSAQAKVAADIKQVAQDERSLTTALESSTSSSGASTATSATPSGSTTGTTGTTGVTGSTGSSATEASGGSSGSTGGTGGQTKKATPQQVAVDQASVDTAEANLADAQQPVAGANLVSTIAGTVASISIADGDSVSAGSDSSVAQVVVIGKGSSYELTTSIAVTEIGKVAVGQSALVTPDSTNTTVNGHV